MNKSTKKILIASSCVAVAAGALYFAIPRVKARVDAFADDLKKDIKAQIEQAAAIGTTNNALQSALVQAQEQKKVSQAAIAKASAAAESFKANPSVRTGLDVINTFWQNGVQLPRTSQTLKVLGTNDTIALLANGNTARVTVAPVARDANGQTAMDRMIADNKRKSGMA